MHAAPVRALFWAPRILCVLFAVFLGVFALDVFGEGGGVWETIVAFLIHLAPAFVVLVVLAVSWRREWVGAVVFGALAVCYVALTRGRLHWGAYASISGPMVLIGLLFLLNWAGTARSSLQ